MTFTDEPIYHIPIRRTALRMPRSGSRLHCAALSACSSTSSGRRNGTQQYVAKAAAGGTSIMAAPAIHDPMAGEGANRIIVAPA